MARQDEGSSLSVEDQNLKDAFREVFMGSPKGKLVLKELLIFAGVFDLSYTGNSDTYFREGKRAVGLKIMDALDTRSWDRLKELERAGVGLTDIFSEDE